MAFKDLFSLQRPKDMQTFSVSSKEASREPSSALVRPSIEGMEGEPPVDWAPIMESIIADFEKQAGGFMRPVTDMGKLAGGVTEVITRPEAGKSTTVPGLYREALQRGTREPEITSGAFGESIMKNYPKVPWALAGLLGSIADIGQPGPEDVGKLGKALGNVKIKGLKKVIRTSAGESPDLQALKNLAVKLRAEQKGVKAGLSAGVKETRAALMGAFRQKSINENAVKRTLIDYSKNLPAEARAKFLPSITKAKNAEDLVRVFGRIDGILETLSKKEAVGSIKSTYGRMLSSKNIAIEYKDKIKNLLADVDFSKMSDNKKAEIAGIVSYLEEQTAAGAEVELPRRIMRQIDRLSKKPINELTFRELKFIQDELDFMDKVGKTKLRARRNIYKMQKERAAKELLAGTKNLDRYIDKSAPFGEELNFQDKFKNQVNSLMRRAQKADLAISPMDVFWDIMDGGKGTYDGPNFRIMKQATDVNFGKYLDLKDEAQLPVIKKAKDLGLTDKNFERIGVHAAREQEGGVQKLLNSGLTKEEIDKVQLTPAEEEWLKLAKEKIEDFYPRVKAVMRDTYNQPVGKVKEYYPFLTDWGAMDDAEVYQRIGSNAEEFGMPAKNVEFSAVKARTGAGEQKIKLNAMEIFMNHTDNAAYLVEMGPYNKMLYEIVNSPAYREKAGALGQRYAMEWIDLVSRKGGKAGAGQIKWLDTIRRNLGLGVLGFKVTSMLMQPLSILDGASHIGNYAFRGAQNVATDPAWRKIVLQFPEIRTRVGDDPFFGEKTGAEGVKKAAMYGLTKLDKFSAMSVAAGAYEKFLVENGIPIDLNTLNKSAMNYAQRVVRRTQNSSLFKDAPLALSKGMLTGNKSIDKAIFSFQSFMLGRWSNIRHDAWRAGVRQGNIKKAAKIAGWLALSTLAQSGIRAGYNKTKNLILGKDEKDESFWKGLAKEAVTSVPFVGNLVSSAMYGSIPVAAVDVINDIVKDTATIIKGKKIETKLKGFARMAMDIGTAAGVPGTTEARGWLEGMMRKNPTASSKGAALKKQYKELIMQGRDKEAEELWSEGISKIGDKYWEETGKELTQPTWESIVKAMEKAEK